MTIRPISLDPVGATVTLWHDEVGHGGTTALAALAFAAGPDGAPNPRFLALPCPTCGSVSTHPVAGGCAPRAVQLLFVHLYLAHQVGGATTWLQALAVHRQAVAAQDGLDRWQLTGAQATDTQ